MSDQRGSEELPGASPVDDVRRVREGLGERYGNDVRRLAQYAREVADKTRQELGCERVSKPQGKATTRTVG